MAQHLNNHQPERRSNRIDKMNTKSIGYCKKLATKKRRQLFKQNNEEKF